MTHDTCFARLHDLYVSRSLHSSSPFSLSLSQREQQTRRKTNDDDEEYEEETTNANIIRPNNKKYKTKTSQVLIPRLIVLMFCNVCVCVCVACENLN